MVKFLMIVNFKMIDDLFLVSGTQSNFYFLIVFTNGFDYFLSEGKLQLAIHLRKQIVWIYSNSSLVLKKLVFFVFLNRCQKFVNIGVVRFLWQGFSCQLSVVSYLLLLFDNFILMMYNSLILIDCFLIDDCFASSLTLVWDCSGNPLLARLQAVKIAA